MKRAIIVWSLAVVGGGAGVRGDVVVLANRAARTVQFALSSPPGPETGHSLESGALMPVRVTGPIEVSFGAGRGARHYELAPNSVSFFYTVANSSAVELQQIGFEDRADEIEPSSPGPQGTAPSDAGETATTDHKPDAERPGPAAQETPPVAAAALPPPEVATITVKVLVDDDQQAVRSVWEPQLRKRVAECSQILEQHCFVRLKVVAIGNWDSDDSITDFTEALREFERKVDPRPADLAIGFTSQFHATTGRTNLGGIHGPFNNHILIREWAGKVPAAGRLELLVHEVGHYLGAAHSPEQTSVMRPILADRQSNSVKFHIGYDPVNTLIMNLVSEEIAERHVRSFGGLSPRTRRQLMSIYGELAKTMPRDPAAGQFLAFLGRVELRQPEPRPTDSPLVAGTRVVVAAIVDAAQTPDPSTGSLDDDPHNPTGDRLSQLYFRRAAHAASKLPPELAARCYILGLAVALDPTDRLRGNPITGSLLRSLETDAERAGRLAVIGSPTLNERDDLLLHFLVSGALTAVGNSQLAEEAGVAKEVSDWQPGGSGFSFADLAADYAGIEFAKYVQGGPQRLEQLAETFQVADFMPDASDLPEGLTRRQFAEQYDSVSDTRFRLLQEGIRRRIRDLPGYRAAQQPPEKTAAPKSAPGVPN